jgi:hypothetical protein
MTLLPTPNQYSACLTVTDFPFAKQRHIAAFGLTSDVAVDRCTLLATQEGWTPPKCWQWWRRRDAKVPYVSHCC